MVELPGHGGGHRQCDDGIDGLHAELPPQYAQGGNEQDGVDDEIVDLCWHTSSPEQNGRHTRYTARRDIVGQQEDGPSYGIGDHGDGYHHIVFQFIQHKGFCWLFHSQDINFAAKVRKS